MSVRPIARVTIRAMGANRGPGAVVARIEDAANIGVSEMFNGPGEFHMTLPTDHPQAGVIEPWQTHYTVERWTGAVWLPQFYGLITDFDADDNSVIFYGLDYLALVDRVIDTRYTPGSPELPHTAGGSKYVDQTTYDIVFDLIDYARTKPNSPVGFIGWDLGGGSLVEKSTIYSTFASVRSVIAGLVETHRQGTGKRTRFYIHTDDGTSFDFRLLEDSGTDRPALVLEYGSLVQGFRLIGFGDFATTAHGIGRTQTGFELFYKSAISPGMDPAVWGNIETVNAWEAVTDENDLQRRVQQFAATAGRVGKRVALGLRVEGLQPFDGFSIADCVPVVIQRGVIDTTNYGSGLWAIYGVEWRVFPDGHTELSLVLAPKEDGYPVNPDLLESAEFVPTPQLGAGYVEPVGDVGKVYIDLSTGAIWEKQPDGSYLKIQEPAALAAPTNLVVTSEAVENTDGTQNINLKVTLDQPAGVGLSGSWVEVTQQNIDGVPVWDHPITAFIPAGQTTATLTGLDGSALLWVRAYSVTLWEKASGATSALTHTTSYDAVAPGQPQLVQVTGAVRAIVASWANQQVPDLQFYEVRSAVDDGTGTGPGVTPTWSIYRVKTNFVYIGSLLHEQKYWLQVRSVDTSGNVELSGDPPTAVDYITNPEIGWTDAVSADTVLVDGDMLALGAVGTQHIEVIGLSADILRTGTLKINTASDSMIDGIKVYLDEQQIGLWDETGLYVFNETDASDYVRISDGGITVFKTGLPTAAITPDGINATAVAFGSLPGGHNLILNSSFELADFAAAASSQTFTDTGGTPGWAAGYRTVAPDNITEGTALTITAAGFA